MCPATTACCVRPASCWPSACPPMAVCWWWAQAAGWSWKTWRWRTSAGASTAWIPASPCWTLRRSGCKAGALHHGYVQSAPAGPFDGATCLLTFHFVPREERVPMAAEIRRRLKPGAPLVVAHLSVADGAGPGGEGGAGERGLWLSRYAAFQVASGVPPEHAARARDKVAAELAVLTPQEDEAILREAGFSDVQMFYMGFAFRGWVASA